MEEFVEISRSGIVETKKSVKRIVFDVISWSFLIFIAVYFIFDAFLPNKTVYYFGLKGYTVQSESMVGIYNKNDIVFVTTPNYGTLEVGDIITYETFAAERIGSGDNYSVRTTKIVNTHYLAEIDVDVNGEMNYKTMCYANFHNAKETWTSGDFDKYHDIKGNEILLRQDKILGRAIFSIPWLGNVNEVFQTVLGDRIFVLLIFSDIIIYSILFDMLWNDYRDSRIDDSIIVIKDNGLENEVDEDQKD